MPSTAERAAISRALKLLSARERNVLTRNRQHGLIGVMELLKVERPEALAELDRIKVKVEVAARREARKPPEETRQPGRSLAPPAHEPRLDGPALRSSGLIPASTPTRRRAKYKDKACRDCGKAFTPKAARQVKCPECRGEGPVAPVTVRHDESVKRTEPAPAPRVVAQERVDALMPAVEHLEQREDIARLGEQLAALQRGLTDFAAEFARLLERSANDNAPEQRS